MSASVSSCILTSWLLILTWTWMNLRISSLMLLTNFCFVSFACIANVPVTICNSRIYNPSSSDCRRSDWTNNLKDYSPSSITCAEIAFCNQKAPTLGRRKPVLDTWRTHYQFCQFLRPHTVRSGLFVKALMSSEGETTVANTQIVF